MIKDLTDFEKLVKLCRKHGVKNLSMGDLTLVFGEDPKKSRREGETDSEESDAPTGELTPEQLMFYSAGGEIS